MPFVRNSVSKNKHIKLSQKQKKQDESSAILRCVGAGRLTSLQCIQCLVRITAMLPLWQGKIFPFLQVELQQPKWVYLVLRQIVAQNQVGVNNHKLLCAAQKWVGIWHIAMSHSCLGRHICPLCPAPLPLPPCPPLPPSKPLYWLRSVPALAQVG